MNNPVFFSGGRQRGATLIEVLVSMFILALGVMALLAMQVRTSAGIKEAENMSIVSQATQNFVESMMINPDLELDTSTTPPSTKKIYDHYLGDCPPKANAAIGATGANIARTDMVAGPKNRFCAAIQGIQGVDPTKIKPDIKGDAIIVTWTMKMDGSDDGVSYTYTQSLDN